MLLWGVCGDRMKGYGEAEKGEGGENGLPVAPMSP